MLSDTAPELPEFEAENILYGYVVPNVISMASPCRALPFATMPISSRVADFVYRLQVFRTLQDLHANDNELPFTLTLIISVRDRASVSFVISTLHSLGTNL